MYKKLRIDKWCLCEKQLLHLTA